MIGTEGQLGVITEVELKTIKDYPLQHLFILVPPWEENLIQHLDILKRIQNFREDVLLCEFVDSNSFCYLPAQDRPNQNMDALFFEIKKDKFDYFYHNFLLKLEYVDQSLIFELSGEKFHNLRASIPRAVFEANAHMGVIKMGTDIQVQTEQFESLMQLYRELAQKGIRYNLFGHFGDAHLHFNFMPTPKTVPKCQAYLEKLYSDSIKLKASPFAEHGIGILKQKYIRDFWSPAQYEEFKKLKAEHDPHNQFFPKGYMGINQ
jgi:glycolate oxidase